REERSFLEVVDATFHKEAGNDRRDL
ncbi:MAG: hypothetical protein JWR56_2043, partial [Massilia sp.]|nr:hypothetical protein [Massilia sp.]